MEDTLKKMNELLKKDIDKGLSIETANHYYFSMMLLMDEKNKLETKVNEAMDFIKYELYDSAKDGDYIIPYVEELKKLLEG